MWTPAPRFKCCGATTHLQHEVRIPNYAVLSKVDFTKFE